MILDEPTSNLDSWSEADWFDRFRTLVNGRTAIIITHRLTIARRADVIHVMDRGQIVESGTHNDLLNLGGVYANSWSTQIEDGSSVIDSLKLQDTSDIEFDLEQAACRLLGK
jgi:ATP-binding cassette subfamily B protein